MFDSIFAGLTEVDHRFFYWANGAPHPSLLDGFMFQVSQSSWWYVAAIVFIGTALYRRQKNLLLFLLILLGVILSVDWFCYNMLKPFVMRERPCMALPGVWLPNLGYCKDLFGFPSNHSANSMAVVVFTWLWWGRSYGLILLPVALLIGFSRVYLGVHFPMDVAMGYVVGFCFSVVWFAAVTKLRRL